MNNIEQMAGACMQIVMPANQLLQEMQQLRDDMLRECIRIGRDIERNSIKQMLEKPMSIEEAAESLGCCPNTVNNLIASGKLEAYYVGSNRKIQPKAIQEYKLKSRVVP